MQKGRIEEIDIIKGIAIILMVAGHSGAPFTDFIYLFHMAVFFIASGFTYKESSSDSINNVKTAIIKRIRQLWVPYFFGTTLFTLLHNFFITINVYTDNKELLNYITANYYSTLPRLSERDMLIDVIKAFFFGGDTWLGVALWFLRILFVITSSYVVADYIAKKLFGKNAIIVQLFISVVLLAFGYYSSIKHINLHGLGHAASCYCLFFIGNLLSRHQFWKDWKWPQFTVAAVTAFLILLWLNPRGSIALGGNSYKNPAFLLVASISGWFFLLGVAALIREVSVKKAFIFLGKNTMPIVLFHLLAFKLVALVVVHIYHVPDFCIAAFPNLYGSHGLWWLAYTSVGVSVPVLVNYCYRATRGRLKI